MRFGGVGAGQEEGFGLANVVVRPIRFVFAEGADITTHSRSHTQARITFDVVGANSPFKETVGEV